MNIEIPSQLKRIIESYCTEHRMTMIEFFHTAIKEFMGEFNPYVGKKQPVKIGIVQDTIQYIKREKHNEFVKLIHNNPPPQSESREVITINFKENRYLSDFLNKVLEDNILDYSKNKTNLLCRIATWYLNRQYQNDTKEKKNTEYYFKK